MSSPSSVLETCLRTNKGRWNKYIFAQLLDNEFGADMVIAHYRDAPYGSCFYIDRDADRESISCNRCYGMWWIFAANMKMKITVVSSMNMEYRLWFNKRRFYYDTLMATNQLPTDCINITCDYINGQVTDAPYKCPLSRNQIQKPEYYYLMISDQKGGLATCGLCIYSKLNFVILLRDFTKAWWLEHEKSCLHQDNLKKLQ